MVKAHNLLLRGLNSIYLQAPYVSIPADIKDFFIFCRAWIHTVTVHHSYEDRIFFPDIIKLTGREDIVSGEQELHRVLHEGLERFEDWIRGVEADMQKWDWAGENGLKAVLDSFANTFVRHLREEVDMLRSLKDYDSQQLLDAWNHTEDEVIKTVTKDALVRSSFLISLRRMLTFSYGQYDKIPAGLGCVDKREWVPPLPWFMPYLVNWWYSRRHRGAWRFCPSDFWGNPRPLIFDEEYAKKATAAPGGILGKWLRL